MSKNKHKPNHLTPEEILGGAFSDSILEIYKSDGLTIKIDKEDAEAIMNLVKEYNKKVEQLNWHLDNLRLARQLIKQADNQ